VVAHKSPVAGILAAHRETIGDPATGQKKTAGAPAISAGGMAKPARTYYMRLSALPPAPPWRHAEQHKRIVEPFGVSARSLPLATLADPGAPGRF